MLSCCLIQGGKGARYKANEETDELGSIDAERLLNYYRKKYDANGRTNAHGEKVKYVLEEFVPDISKESMKPMPTRAPFRRRIIQSTRGLMVLCSIVAALFFSLFSMVILLIVFVREAAKIQPLT